jgi:uroporphyrinogen decarboxylase
VNPIIDVLRGATPKRRGLWIMRQAGRYLPEYRELRSRAGSFLGLCYDPELAAEVTLQPLRRFDLDAAILFSDILVVPHAMGLSLEFKEGEGPHLQTVSDAEGVARLVVSADAEKFARVYETVARVKSGLPAERALIGFCGAPWTVASYMIEGGSSGRKRALAVAIENPAWFRAMLEKLIATSIQYLLGQIKAGAQLVQVFDSWAGDVPVEHRERLVIKPMAEIIKGVRVVHPGFPVIAFARGVGDGHAAVAAGTGANAVGVEEDADIGKVLAGLPAQVAVQGNLANTVLLGNEENLDSEAKRILASVPRNRHIFNLGHGILPETPISRVERLVRLVREFG